MASERALQVDQARRQWYQARCLQRLAENQKLAGKIGRSELTLSREEVVER